MKVLNIFLSILILLLAVASAVFSYFLFEKRTQLVDGWGKMAKAINTSAKNLDKGSGTTVAKDLSVENLGHDKYDDLDSKLPKLQSHASTIIAERDKMASAIRTIAETVEMDNVPGLDAFKSVKSYKSNTNSAVSQVKTVISRRDNAFRRFCSAGGELGVEMSESALKGSNYSSELNKFDKKVNTVKSRLSNASSQFTKIYRYAGKSSPLTFDDSSYKSSTNKVVGAVRELQNKYARSQETIKSKNAKVSNLLNTIKAKDGKISEQKVAINKKDLEIRRLLGIIHGTPDAGGKTADLWEPGSIEARRAVQGRIIKVDRKYGFVVIDLGKGTVVNQKIGKKVSPANPEIPVGAKMVVARDVDSADGEYIGEIEIAKVHGDCSIANVISTAKGKGVAVGDTVFFSEEQLKSMANKK